MIYTGTFYDTHKHITWYTQTHSTGSSESHCALIKVLEVMSTSVCTGLNPFYYIRKHFLQICLWDVSYIRSYCSF